MARVVALQRDGALLLVLDAGPGLDDVHLIICFIVELHRDGQQAVLHRERVDGGVAVARLAVVGDLQLQVLVAAGVLHLDGGQMDGIDGAEGRQCREVKVVAGIAQFLQRGRLVAEVGHVQILTLPGMQQQLQRGGLNSDVALPGSCRKGGGEEHCS